MTRTRTMARRGYRVHSGASMVPAGCAPAATGIPAETSSIALDEALERSQGVPIPDRIAVVVWKALRLAGVNAARVQGLGASVSGAEPMSLPGVKALCFDVFGTVVDWRGEHRARGRSGARVSGGITRDWHAFADAWRARYQPALEEVQERPAPLDQARRPPPREPAGAARRSMRSAGSPRPRSITSIAPGTGSTRGRTRSKA